MIYTQYKAEEELRELIEDTFDLCSTNKEEIYWLITVLRGIMRIPNKRTDNHVENYKLNYWQYQLNPIIQKYIKRWKF